MNASLQRKTGVVLSYIDMALQIVISLVYTPVTLSLLGQNEYGLYSLASSTIAYLSLITLGIGGAYVRFYMRRKVVGDDDGIRQLNSLYLVLYFLAGIVALFAGFVVVSKSGAIFTALTYEEIAITKILLAMLIVNLAVSFPASLFNAYITVNERFVTQRVLTIARHLTSPLLVLPILVMGYGSIGYVLVTVAVNIVFELFNVVYAVCKLKMRFSFHGQKLALCKEIALFSFFLLLNQIIDQVNSNVGNLLLGIYQGSAAVAVYGVARQITGYFFQFSVAVSSVYEPQVNNLVASGASSKVMGELMARIGRIQFIILALVLSGLFFFGQPFITLWAGDAYSDAYYIILITCCPVIIPLVQNAGLAIQQAMNRHQARSATYFVMAILNVAMSIPLIKRYSYMGAAIGTCISYILCNIIFMNIYYHKALKLDMIHFWKEIAAFIPSLIAPIVLGLALKILDVDLYSWRSLIGFVLLYCIVYCLSMYLFGLNKDEKALVDRILHRGKEMEKNTIGKKETKPAVSFRLKTSQGGWRHYSVSLCDGKKTLVIPFTQDEFMRAYLSDFILRPSCYECQFKVDSYHSDLTIGDYWGIDSVLPAFNDNKGVSEVIARSPKGLEALMSISSLELVEVSRNVAGQSALDYSAILPSRRDDYFDLYKSEGLREANSRIIPPVKKRPIGNLVKKIGRKVLSKYRYRPGISLVKSPESFFIDNALSDSFSLRQSCTGCGACASACPKNAIVMKKDKEGFCYPDIDASLCIDCGLCSRICPVKREAKAFHTHYFAAKNRDEAERLASSSGGVFILLAKTALSLGGIVYGAEFTESLTVRHMGEETLDGVCKFMGSKYVQSDIGNCYVEAESHLKNGRYVLFSGTPCQIAGLKSYLGKDYDNLLVVDVICHGAPSPAVFAKYLSDMNIVTGGGV